MGMTVPTFSSPPSQDSGAPGAITRGICSLTYKGRTFRFRTNPNEIWWSYELIKNIEETYGGRVVQILGTRLGDLQVKVECGRGGWNYMMAMVMFLRDMISDQRDGSTAEFVYTTRNWWLKVYAMSIPFSDQLTATTREVQLNFKIQEDLSGELSKVSLDGELARMSDGTYPIGQMHNQYNDASWTTYGGMVPTMPNPSGPTYPTSGVTNLVDTDIIGNNFLGLNPIPGIPGLAVPKIEGIPGV